MKNLIYFLFICLLSGCCLTGNNKSERVIHSLNGTWEIARTDTGSEIPFQFPGSIPVPGLVDLSSPAIEQQETLYEDALYWYRRTFTIDHDPYAVARLKINKSKYHTRVYINGQFAGENYYCFTPSYFDIKPFLSESGGQNELVISVGCMNNLPDTINNGHDFEKIKYIPGIYDEVSLILANKPYITNIQTVPDIIKEELRFVTDIETDLELPIHIHYSIREAATGKEIAKGNYSDESMNDSNHKTYDFTLSLPGFTQWIPDNPFLYELELSTGADSKKVRFGMRSFGFDEKNALLNGKKYYMRGTNVCIFRFFEDPDRNSLPWDRDWVVKLHKRFKEMNWNSIRYCIGLPPEIWYEVADSLGLLIQNEFPLWTGGSGGFERIQPGMNAKHLAAEYQDWLPEHWNHPCVVIWDAQNECVTDTIGKAIEMVRDLDLSGRPWENGWSAPVTSTDPMETHPYLFSRYMRETPAVAGPLKELLAEIRIPHNGPSERDPSPDGKPYENPIIINEYGWLWLNRDASPTTLTEHVYKNAFPEAITDDERMETYARHLGILTEYWRAHRTSAGVLHFCGLGYSRPDPPRGQTSDHFIDIKNLTFEPYFYTYVKPAFSPVGIMVELFDKMLPVGKTISIPVHIINDTYETWQDSLRLVIRGDELPGTTKSIWCSVEGPGEKIEIIDIELPDAPGDYSIEAVIIYKEEEIKSIRLLNIQ